jgi:hypothetical protein
VKTEYHVAQSHEIKGAVMNRIQLVLQSDQPFDGKLPAHHLGMLLAQLPIAVRGAISMALRNRSTTQGKTPQWLDRAADVRFVGHEANGITTLFFEAPTLGQAAEEIYQQSSLFPELRPASEDTGFDLFGDVLTDVAEQESDSLHFDPALLGRVIRFHKVFQHQSPFTGIQLISRRYTSEHPALFTSHTIEAAKCLLGKTPASHRVRIVGNLDGLEASTQRFSVLLDTGQKVIGIFGEEDVQTMHDLWRKRIIVLGTAIYRASGSLLRIDADAVKSGEGEGAFFSHLPTPTHARLDLAKLRKPQGPRSGLAAIMGQWPGDETDEEIAAALETVS